MPRWAEGVGLVLVSVVLIGAILVYAKFTTQKNSKVAAAQKDETSNLLEEASSIPDVPKVEVSRAPRPAKARPAPKPARPRAMFRWRRNPRRSLGGLSSWVRRSRHPI